MLIFIRNDCYFFPLVLICREGISEINFFSNDNGNHVAIKRIVTLNCLM